MAPRASSTASTAAAAAADGDGGGMLRLVLEAMNAIPASDKAAYLAAAANVPHLVETESPPLQFLRFERYNPWAAARRLARYWEIRVAAFGPDRAYRPMAYRSDGAGALDAADWAVLQTGYLMAPSDFPPPRRGEGGGDDGRSGGGGSDNHQQQRRRRRAVLVYDGSKLPARGTAGPQRVRCWFYILQALVIREDENDGAVIAAEAAAGGVRSQVEEEEDELVVLAVMNKLTFQRSFVSDKKLKVEILKAAFPVRFAKAYLVQEPVRTGPRTFLEWMVPIMVHMVGNCFRSQLEAIAGDSVADVRRKLEEEAGLSKHSLPENLGGTWNDARFAAWLQRRQDLERSRHRHLQQPQPPAQQQQEALISCDPSRQKDNVEATRMVLEWNQICEQEKGVEQEQEHEQHSGVRLAGFKRGRGDGMPEVESEKEGKGSSLRGAASAASQPLLLQKQPPPAPQQILGRRCNDNDDDDDRETLQPEHGRTDQDEKDLDKNQTSCALVTPSHEGTAVASNRSPQAFAASSARQSVSQFPAANTAAAATPSQHSTLEKGNNSSRRSNNNINRNINSTSNNSTSNSTTKINSTAKINSSSSTEINSSRRLVLLEKELECALQSIPNEEKRDYLAARKAAPAVVRTETPVSRFFSRPIDCGGDGAVAAAASLLCRHWRYRRLVFGEDRACLPIRDALESGADDLRILRSGFLAPLPRRDGDAGPALLWNRSRLPENVDSDSELRCLFYWMVRVLFLPSSERAETDVTSNSGVSFLHLLSRESFLRKDATRAYGAVREWLHERAFGALETVDSSAASPPPIHLLCVAPPAEQPCRQTFLGIAVPWTLQQLGSEARTAAIHVADNEQDTFDKLRPYGFVREQLPKQLGGYLEMVPKQLGGYLETESAEQPPAPAPEGAAESVQDKEPAPGRPAGSQKVACSLPNTEDNANVATVLQHQIPPREEDAALIGAELLLGFKTAEEQAPPTTFTRQQQQQQQDGGGDSHGFSKEIHLSKPSVAVAEETVKVGDGAKTSTIDCDDCDERDKKIAPNPAAAPKAAAAKVRQVLQDGHSNQCPPATLGEEGRKIRGEAGEETAWERERRMNAARSRRKRERQRQKVDSLTHQRSDLIARNAKLRNENDWLENILRVAVHDVVARLEERQRQWRQQQQNLQASSTAILPQHLLNWSAPKDGLTSDADKEIATLSLRQHTQTPQNINKPAPIATLEQPQAALAALLSPRTNEHATRRDGLPQPPSSLVNHYQQQLQFPSSDRPAALESILQTAAQSTSSLRFPPAGAVTAGVTISGNQGNRSNAATAYSLSSHPASSSVLGCRWSPTSSSSSCASGSAMLPSSSSPKHTGLVPPPPPSRTTEPHHHRHGGRSWR